MDEIRDGWTLWKIHIISEDADPDAGHGDGSDDNVNAEDFGPVRRKQPQIRPATCSHEKRVCGTRSTKQPTRTGTTVYNVLAREKV